LGLYRSLSTCGKGPTLRAAVIRGILTFGCHCIPPSVTFTIHWTYIDAAVLSLMLISHFSSPLRCSHIHVCMG
jgi:hypothetical protein